jgi:hypothetical protein
LRRRGERRGPGAAVTRYFHGAAQPTAAANSHAARALFDGTLQFSHVNGVPAGTGEVRITSNGVLVARIYMDSQVRAEALSPLQGC